MQRIHGNHVRQLFRVDRLERPIQNTCQTTELQCLQGCEILLEGESVSFVKIGILGSVLARYANELRGEGIIKRSAKCRHSQFPYQISPLSVVEPLT